MAEESPYYGVCDPCRSAGVATLRTLHGIVRMDVAMHLLSRERRYGLQQLEGNVLRR